MTEKHIYFGPNAAYVRSLLERHHLGGMITARDLDSEGAPVIESGPDLEPGTLALTGPLIAKLVSALVSEAMLADYARTGNERTLRAALDEAPRIGREATS